MYDLRSFFLNGSLCYKPLTRLGFTFEACPINNEHRAVLRESLTAASKVPHADPQTEGFGFSLANAVKQISGKQFTTPAQDEIESGRTINRIKFRHMAVETIYGYWLPTTYADVVREKLEKIENNSLERMRSFAAELESVTKKALEAELENHLEGLRAFFAAHSVKIEPRIDYRRKFDDFVRIRKAWLGDALRMERTVKRLHLEPMPDIWEDKTSADRFEASFFEDLALRFDSSGKSWVVSVLKDQLDLGSDSGPENIKVALEKRLKTGLRDTIWSESEDELESEADAQ